MVSRLLTRIAMHVDCIGHGLSSRTSSGGISCAGTASWMLTVHVCMLRCVSACMLHARGSSAESRAEHLQFWPPHLFACADVPTLRHRSDHFPASRLLNVNVERSSRLRPWSTAGDCAPGSVESLVLDSRGSGRSVVGTDCYGRSSRRFEGRTWSKLCSGAALRADRALLSFFGECVRVRVLSSCWYAGEESFSC